MSRVTIREYSGPFNADEFNRVLGIPPNLIGEPADPNPNKSRPRKPRLVYPPDLLRWFEVLEEFPDRLGIVADWCEERTDYHATVAMLAPALRFAWDKGRWPERIGEMKISSRGPGGRVRTSTGRNLYFWTATEKSLLKDTFEASWLSGPSHGFAFTMAKMRACQCRSVRPSQWSTLTLRYTTRPVKLIEAFRQLSTLIGDQS